MGNTGGRNTCWAKISPRADPQPPRRPLQPFSPLDCLVEWKQHTLDHLEEENLMPDDRSDLLQGTLELLVLKALSLAPMHGWGIGHRIGQLSKEVFQVNQ